jgi:hypothetical protein
MEARVMARSFTSNYITTAHRGSSNTSNCTVAAWLNPSALGAVDRFWFGNGLVNNNSGWGAFTSTTVSAGNLAVYVIGAGNQSFGTGIPLNTWSHVAIVLGTSNAFSLYINGVFQSTITAAAPTSPVEDSCAIGGSPGFVSYYAGLMADVAFWSVVLSATEIAGLAKGIRPYVIRPGSLSLWLPLGGLQSPEPDLSGNLSNGTLSGTTAAFGPPFAPFTPRWPQAPIFVPAPFILMPQIVT